MENSFNSIMYSLGDKFFYKQFNIPIYQRLYVWEEEQVNTLIEDLVKDYLHDKKHNFKNHVYYLGGIVVVENQGKYDLIDGQQRFTTLKILREILEDKKLTLDFSIRENVWEEFNNVKESDNSDIQRMKKAKKLLEIGLEKKYNYQEIAKEDFLIYLKNKVKLVVTQAPSDADLNKLFELINGRGEQLEQHQILKAKILANIDDGQERNKYGKVWDICANMNELFEISIKKSLLKENKKKYISITWEDYFKNYKDLDYDQLLEKLYCGSKSEIGESSSIHEIIEGGKDDNGSNNNKIDPEDESSAEYNPIISFELFLLYSLVSFGDIDYFKKIESDKIEFKDKNLIKIFETVLPNLLINKEKTKEMSDEAKEFIKHLFEFRRKFDKWIIRNRKEKDDKSNDTDHQLLKIKKLENGKTISRQVVNMDNSRDLSLLQSMLYHAHTRNTQEWIIPFLSNVKDNGMVENLTLLKNIDDYLYSYVKPTGTVLERAGSFNNESFSGCNEIIKYLKKIPKNYHYFSHYWFYKMDWIIWDLMNNQEKEKNKKFKFTARNSIEHISPQKPQDNNVDKDKVSESYLNSFGNLFLVSVSQNSSVGNEGFNTKIAKFLKDEDKNKDIKNLKLNLLSNYSSWGDDGVKKHFDDCLQKIKEYYNFRTRQ